VALTGGRRQEKPVREVFESAGREYTIEAYSIGDTGKWGCAVYPRRQVRGIALFEPDAQFVQGRLVPFDTDREAVAGGKAYILAEFLSLRG
jgi:hypothetical protein